MTVAVESGTDLAAVIGVLRESEDCSGENPYVAKKRDSESTRTDVEKIYELIGRRIKQLRLAKGWSQGDLGEKLGIGASSISYIESGARRISVADIEAFAEIFDLEVKTFLKGVWL